MPIRIVFGAPLTFDSKDGPSPNRVSADDEANGKGSGLRDVSDEELKRAHGAYVDALKRLFDDNKAKFGYGDRELCIL